VPESEYDFRIVNYGSGSPERGPSVVSNWLKPANKTMAGAVRFIPLGMRIPLGQGAESMVTAANGVLGLEDNPTQSGGKDYLKPTLDNAMMGVDATNVVPVICTGSFDVSAT
jgi:hypothetical protein